MRSAEDVEPGFVHDTFSAFYPLAAASPAIRSFHLEEHGLRWVPRARRARAPVARRRLGAAAPGPRGHRRLLDDRDHPGDGAAWLELCGQWDRIGEHLVQRAGQPVPAGPLRSRDAGPAAAPSAAWTSSRRCSPRRRTWAQRSSAATAARLLLAGNAGHADIPLDAPGSGLMGLLMTMLGQTVGFPVPEGGAGKLSQALARRIESPRRRDPLLDTG